MFFSLYNYFDKIISVSELTKNQNIKSFKNFIDDYETKMDFVINNINYKQALRLKDKKEIMDYHGQTYLLSTNAYTTSNVEIKGFELPRKENINFINIGRLEPEKDQEKLIYAFSEIIKVNKNIKLYLVGEGVLRSQLEALIKKLNLEDKVIFTGQIGNPYALLDLCDCFVLSSNHEGQPMVLLEALILGKPIIVTNIPGSRSVIEGGYGLIVDNSIKGLISGMTDFINGRKINEKEFDYIAYSKKAMICSIKKSAYKVKLQSVGSFFHPH
ncbi:glycosyltransferase [Terrilactibacillus sp. S3-3]|nr:glycosyltransferase [Terrilactibacillus sp. S3-3]